MKFRVICFDGEIDPAFPQYRTTLDTVYDERLPKNSLARKLKFRPNNYLVRTYSPEGKTANGIHVTKNERWPRVWAHILACAHDNPHALYPGDLVMFTRHCEEYLGEDLPLEEKYLGERLPIEILNYRAIVAVIENKPIQTRF